MAQRSGPCHQPQTGLLFLVSGAPEVSPKTGLATENGVEPNLLTCGNAPLLGLVTRTRALGLAPASGLTPPVFPALLSRRHSHWVISLAHPTEQVDDAAELPAPTAGQECSPWRGRFPLSLLGNSRRPGVSECFFAKAAERSAP
jgi:hypothetical protein